MAYSLSPRLLELSKITHAHLAGLKIVSVLVAREWVARRGGRRDKHFSVLKNHENAWRNLIFFHSPL